MSFGYSYYFDLEMIFGSFFLRLVLSEFLGAGL